VHLLRLGRSARQAQLHTLISDIQRRQKNLITRLQQQDDTGDSQADQEYRQASSGGSLNWPPTTGPAPKNSPSSRPPHQDTQETTPTC
jgi:hypothetical protein